MDKLAAFSVTFANVTKLQAQVLEHCWSEMFGKESDYFADSNKTKLETRRFYNASTQRLKLMAEIKTKPLPYTNAKVMTDLLESVVETALLRVDSFILGGVVYEGSFVVTDKHLKAPLNVISFQPKVSVSDTETKEQVI